MPLTALAQQPAVATVTGTLLANGQEAEEGTVLAEEMVLETGVEETTMLHLDDGSQFEIGEQTRMIVVKTTAAEAGSKILRLKLMQGWMRAKLANDAQAEGLIFDVETPNAVIGAKMTKSDFEIGYEEGHRETVGIAHGAELRAENLVNGGKRDIPRGSTILITPESMEVFEGTKRSKSSDNTENIVSKTMDKFTNPTTLLVAGGLVGAAALTTALVDQKEEIDESDLIGDFERTDTVEGGDMIQERFSISEGQSSSQLLGFYEATRSGSNCQYAYTRDLSGTVDMNTAFLTLAAVTYTQTCAAETTNVSLSTNTWTCTTQDDKAVLRCTKTDGTQADYQRQ